MKKARQRTRETHSSHASLTPATASMKPSPVLPGSPKKSRQNNRDTHQDDAAPTPAKCLVKPRIPLPGSPTKTARHLDDEAHSADASASRATGSLKPIELVPGSPIEENARHGALEIHSRSASAASTNPASKPNPRLSRPLSKGRQRQGEIQNSSATSTPANERMKPIRGLPGSPTTARQSVSETQSFIASAASTNHAVKPKRLLSRPQSKGRQALVEAQTPNATLTPAIPAMKPNHDMPGSPLSSTIEAIRAHHRERRFAMGIQQVLDRKLESYIRINKTEWHVGDDEATRDKANKDVAAKIKLARKGEGDPSIVKVVRMTDDAGAPADAERARHEREMETLARSLPVAPWVETVPGLGYLGLATIIAETGDLSLYANVAKVWKRLGYAPYNGLAGSSWKRPTWRNGNAALTAEEWTENPFSGRRYSLIHVISVWLKNKQWIGAAKTDDGVGKPNGPYGEVYAERRARTAVTHADWSKQHSHMDALRVMMKEVLKDLWLQWNGVEHKNAVSRQSMCENQARAATSATPAKPVMKSNVRLPGSTIKKTARRSQIETQLLDASATPAIRPLPPIIGMPGSPTRNGRPRSHEAQGEIATSASAKLTLKPMQTLPGSPIENGRQALGESHQPLATASPGHRVFETQCTNAGATYSERKHQ